MKSQFDLIWSKFWEEGDVMFNPLTYEIVERDIERNTIETDLMTLSTSAYDYFVARDVEFERLMLSISLMTKEWFCGEAVGIVLVQDEMDERVIRFYSMEYDF